MVDKVAVIGAGVAGLACARVMRRAGCYVEVFEQDRIIGGRMATTRLGLVPFDTGAQYVTARSDIFRGFLNELLAANYAKQWTPRGADGSPANQLTPWYVGVPGMASLVRPLAEGVLLHTGRRVHTLQRVGDGWRLWFEDETHAGPFAAVAVATPASEAALLVGRMDELVAPLSRVHISPCWALMAQFESNILPVQDVYSDMSEVVRWVARNNAKPSRSPKGDHIVVHASTGWSRETEDVEPEVVAVELWEEVRKLLSLPATVPRQLAAHQWRHGVVEEALGESFLFSSGNRVGIAGDWCLGRLAEHAFESGSGLGRAIVAALS
ncbi:MAG: FAD-dependent oxidoreductase [Proteobacteria bacterium]|nr:FAD-dependent oxidoreductase [Pseudomonadota bacterium]